MSPRGRAACLQGSWRAEPIQLLSCTPTAILSLDSHPLGEEAPRKMPQLRPEQEQLWLILPGQTAAPLGQGKCQEGTRRPTLPCPCVPYGSSYFSQEPRVPLRLSRRVLLVVALQQNALSLCSVASPQWWWFCSSCQHSIIPLIPWKAGATSLGLFQARSSASKEEPEGLFV